MSGATVSFHVGTSTSLSHNNRENIYGNPDIDSTKTHENICYVREDIKKIYSENFDEAVRDYNETQKRSDRKINDYYKKILHDKKTEHQREIIVAIGRADDDIDKDFKKEMLDHYMKGFQERNPNLKVYNAVMHLDEANPHLHINYVPVYETSRGLKKRVGQNKAIEQQGFKTFEEWRESETGILETLMANKSIKRNFKGSHDYMRVSEYKEYAESLNNLKSLKNEFEGHLGQTKQELLDTNEELKQKKEELTGASEKVKQLERIEKGIVEELAFDQKLKQFGYLYQSELKESDIKKIPVVGEVVKLETYRSLEKKYEVALEQNEKLKMSSEFNPVYQGEIRWKLETENKNLKQSLNFEKNINRCLNDRVNELSRENQKFKKEVSMYEKFLEKFNLKEKFKEFISNIKQTKRLIKAKSREMER